MNVFLVTSVPLNPPWDQGDKNLAYTLAQALGEHCFQAFGLAGEPPPAGDNLRLHPFYRSRQPSLLQKAQVYWRLLDRSLSNGRARLGAPAPDVYHLIFRPTRLSSLASRLLPEFQKRPTLHTLPAVSALDGSSASLFFADRLVTISRHATKTLQALGFDRVSYIPPGIAVNAWAGLPAQREALKVRLGLHGGPVVLYPGHTTPGYGLDVLVRALPAVAAQIPGVQFLFACRLRSRNDLQRERRVCEQVRQMGLEQHVRFFHTVADMRLLTGASDLTVLPLETMQDKVDIPISLIESLAAGAPIVISDLAPMNELLDADQTGGEPVGVGLPRGDAPALAQAITHLLSDHAYRKRLAASGQALARARYDARRMAYEYDKIYKELTR